MVIRFQVFALVCLAVIAGSCGGPSRPATPPPPSTAEVLGRYERFTAGGDAWLAALGPEQAIATFTLDEGTVCDLTRAWLPAGVAQPCLGSALGADQRRPTVTHTTPQPIYGLRYRSRPRSSQGAGDPAYLLRTGYDLILRMPGLGIVAYHRRAPEDGGGFAAAHVITCGPAQAPVKTYVEIVNVEGRTDTAIGGRAPWHTYLPLGLDLKQGNAWPEAKGIVVAKPQSVTLYRADGLTEWTRDVQAKPGEAGSYLGLHRGGVLFAEAVTVTRRDGRPGAVGRPVVEPRLWWIDAATAKPKAEERARLIRTRKAPDQHQSRYEADAAFYTDTTVPESWFFVRPSPDDARLWWILGRDGAFAPPTGTAGVIPITNVACYLDGERLVYRKVIEEFLVAYPTPGGPVWGTASYDLASAQQPVFTDLAWADSPALEALLDYWPDREWPCRWLLLRHRDGTWRISHGSATFPDTTGDSPAKLVAYIERDTMDASKRLAPRFERGETATDAYYAARGVAAEARIRALRSDYQDAARRRDAAKARQIARALTPEDYMAFLRGNLATLEDFSWAVGPSVTLFFPADDLAFITQRLDADPAATATAAKTEAAATRARETATQGTEGTGFEATWRQWGADVRNADDASRLGLTGEAYDRFLRDHR